MLDPTPALLDDDVGLCLFSAADAEVEVEDRSRRPSFAFAFVFASAVELVATPSVSSPFNAMIVPFSFDDEDRAEPGPEPVGFLL